MTIRESLLENLAGDLEYNPRRAFAYLCVGAAAGSVWILSPAEKKFTLFPVVFGLGGFALLVKSVFLFRKSSEGLGLSTQRLAAPSEPPSHRTETQAPAFATRAAQFIQDFGTGALLLWPLLILSEDMNNPPEINGLHFRVFFTGAVIFGFGWLMRRISTARSAVN